MVMVKTLGLNKAFLVTFLSTVTLKLCNPGQAITLSFIFLFCNMEIMTLQPRGVVKTK